MDDARRKIKSKWYVIVAKKWWTKVKLWRLMAPQSTTWKNVNGRFTKKRKW